MAMEIKGKIIKKGTFDANGQPTGWDISTGTVDYVLAVLQNGEVLVNGVEVVEWSQERKDAMSSNTKLKREEP